MWQLINYFLLVVT